MTKLKNRDYYAKCSVKELLDEPEVRELPPHLLFGVKGFAELVTFLRGYDAALLDTAPESSLFDGFHEWLQMHHNANPSVCWSLHIRDKHGDGREAIGSFYQLWDAFRAHRDAKGIRGLLDEYREYDLARFGQPTYYRERSYLE